MKWEYLVQENSSDFVRNDPYPKAPLHTFLNSIGKDGWELVSTQFLGNGLTGLVSNYLVIAKRPIEEIPPRPNPKWFKREQIMKTAPQPRTHSDSALPIASESEDETSPRKDMILELRRLTGASVTKCFQALEQTGGDLEAAQHLIQKDSRA